MNEYENTLKIKDNTSFILQSKDCNLSDAKNVNETVFRLNEGRCEVKTMDRINALIAKTFGVVTRYKVLIGTHVFEKDLIAQMFSKSCDCAVTYSENLLVRKAA